MQRASILRSSLRTGLIIGVSAVFIALIGMLQAFSSRYLVGVVTVTEVILVAFGLISGSFAVRRLGKESRVSNKILAGVVSGLVM